MRRISKLLAVFLAMSLIAAACGSDDSSSETTPPTTAATVTTTPPVVVEVDQVFFILDWIAKGTTSPFFLALEKGFWAERNMAVQITRGFGSGDTSARIGLGEGDFGFAGVGAVMRTISEGLPLVEIAPIITTAPASVYAAEGSGIDGSDPSTLCGLSGAVDAGDENDQVFKAFAGSVGIDYNCIDWQYVDGAGVGTVASGQADFVMDWITNLPEWWLADPPIEPESFWVGNEIDIYGNGLITRPDFLDANPDLARRFVEGAVAGWQYVINGGLSAQNEAIDALFKFNPELKEQPNAREFHLANLQLGLTIMLSEQVREDGLGYFDLVKEQRSLDFINEFLLDAPLTLDEAFIADQLIEQGDFAIDVDAARTQLELILGRPNPLLPFMVE